MQGQIRHNGLVSFPRRHASFRQKDQPYGEVALLSSGTSQIACGDSTKNTYLLDGGAGLVRESQNGDPLEFLQPTLPASRVPVVVRVSPGSLKNHDKALPNPFDAFQVHEPQFYLIEGVRRRKVFCWGVPTEAMPDNAIPR